MDLRTKAIMFGAFGAWALSPLAMAQSVVIGDQEYSVTERRVNSYTVGNQHHPDCEILEGGEIAVAWQSNGQISNSDTFGRVWSVAGEAMTPEVHLNPCLSGGWEYGPALGALPGGGYAVAWGEGSRAVYLHIVGSDWAVAGCQAFVGPFEVWPGVATNPDGTILVYWGRQGGSIVGHVGGRFYSADGTPKGEAMVANQTPLGFGSDTLVLASAAGLPDGRFAIAWHNAAGDVLARIYDSAGEAVTDEFVVQSSAGGLRRQVSVGADLRSEVVVAWRGDQAGAWNVYGRRFTSDGTPIGDEWRVNNEPVENLGDIHVSDSWSEQTVIAWEATDADGRGVFARLYGPNGAAVDEAFAVNLHKAGTQSLHWGAGRNAVAIADGRLIFTWDGNGDGDASGAFMTIFAPICRADLDGDGELTFFDFLAFQSLFAAGDPAADFNGDGVLDFFDFLAFQNEFAAGCE